MAIRSRAWRVLSSGFAVSLALSTAMAATEAITAVTPDSAWEAVFRRSEGWTGGDAMYSVNLGDGKVLWLFADSWIGKVSQGRHTAGSRLVNNTLAMHDLPRGGESPATDAVRFLWGTQARSTEPLAWIRPEEPKAIEKNGTRGKAPWYWVADGAVAGGPDGRPRLVVFLWRIARTGDQVMSFRSVGGALAIVDNPQEDWSRWQPRQFAVTHSIPSDAADPRRLPEVTWGSEVLVEKNAERGDTLLIYGYRHEQPGLNELVLARAPASAVDAMDHWEFRTADGWSSKLADAQALAQGLTTEFSVTPIELSGRTTWILIHSETFFGAKIFARAASSPYGPWSKPTAIFDVPELNRAKKHFTYAAKAHLELSRPGELLVTYIVNSLDFSEAVANAEIYRPRFLRVPYAVLPAVDTVNE